MYAFYNDENLAVFDFPSQLKTIGILAFRYTAFAYCYDITSFTFEANSTLTTIGSRAFYNTHFTTIDLPDSVESIANQAFAYNTYLTSITIPISVTTMESEIFKGCTNLSINVEAASLPATWDTNWNIDGLPVVWGYTE